MRKIRILSIIIFMAALISFGAYQKKERDEVDRKGPEIIMDKRKIKVSCSAGKDELLKGVAAVDDRDGDVSDTLIVEAMGNFIKKGRRKISIAAFDSSNNVTKMTRTVVYKGYHSPRFDLEEPLRFPLQTKDIMGTLSVMDMLDGDLTGNIKISSDYNVKVDKAGIYPMVFSVSNSAGDVVNLPVNIEIFDPSVEAGNPQFELSQYIVYTKPGNALNPWDYVRKITLSGIDFERGEDGALYDPNPKQGQKRVSITQEEVVIEQNIDYNTPGTYEIVYRFTNPGEEKEGHIRLIVVVSE